MRRLAYPLALVSSLLVGCGTVESTSRFRTETERLHVADLPAADTPIDTRPADDGRMRSTRVRLRSGDVFTVPGDARLYRDGGKVLVQPGPTSLMVREFAVEDVSAIERKDVWHEVKRVERPSSSDIVPAVILGVIGAVVLSYAAQRSRGLFGGGVAEPWTPPQSTGGGEILR